MLVSEWKEISQNLRLHHLCCRHQPMIAHPTGKSSNIIENRNASVSSEKNSLQLLSPCTPSTIQDSQQNQMFWKLDLFLYSIEKMGRHQLF
jgi:hypothetical protein